MNSKQNLIIISLLLSTSSLFFVAPSLAWMDTSSIRQSQMFRYSTSEDNNESCWISPHFPMGTYSDKDSENEQELCNVDFYNSPQFAICPKLNHTNPGIEIFSIPSEISKKSFERKQCYLDSKKRISGTKKIAKYKVSSSCSYSPAPLFAYHLSRILGNILQVPQAVRRSVITATYNKQANLALDHLNSNLLIAKTWSVLQSQLNSPENNSRSPFILSSDFQTTVGSLIKNSDKDKDWNELMVGQDKSQIERAQLFMQLPQYQELERAEDASSFIDHKWNINDVQRLQTLGDISDMLLFDFIMQQEDRFYNIAYSENWLQKNPQNNQIQWIGNKEYEQNQLANNPEIFKIQKMMLKDNDCALATEKGVSRRNIVEQMHMLENIKHIKQSTYKKILNLNYMLNSSDQKMRNLSQQFNKLCTEELLMTQTDLSFLRKRISNLSAKLKTACEQKSLKLDLDLEYHFTNSSKKYSCDLRMQ